MLYLIFGRNTFTLSEVIGYLDRPILAKFRRNIPGIIKNEIVSGNFDI